MDVEITPDELEPSIGVADQKESLFDFENFYENIKKCIAEAKSNEDVDLGFYLSAYEQLYNFFVLLGGAFQFVALDVKSKVKILQELRKDEEEKSKSINNFLSVKSMINYEKGSKLLEDTKYVSGSRTLLRLHRGLDFIKKFLSEIYKTENDIKLGVVAREVYDSTLASYHTWIIRNAARVAMKFLPTRKELLNKISKNDEEKLRHMLETFPNAIELINAVYDRTQNIYNECKLLDLP